MDESVLLYGDWFDNQAKRYAQHTPEGRDGKQGTPPTLEHIIEYERALLEGTPFQRIDPRKRLSARRREGTANVGDRK